MLCSPIRTATGALAPTGGGDVARSLGEPELYRRTGIQLMPINTIFQLAAHDRASWRGRAALVMLPELVAYELTGEAAGERSNAGTTGLLDVATGDWADRSRRGDRHRPADPADARGAPAACSGSTTARPSTSSRRTTRRARSQQARWPPTGRAFVSAGTWFMVGVERAAARRLRGSAACELLQRARRSRRLPLPEERPRLLAPRAVRGAMGDERRRPARLSQPAHRRTHLASTSATSGFSPRRGWPTRSVPPPGSDDAPRALVARSIVESVAAAVAGVVDQLRGNPARGGARRRRRRRGLALRARANRRARRCPCRRRLHRGNRARQRPPSGHRARPLPRPRRRQKLGLHVLGGSVTSVPACLVA